MACIVASVPDTVMRDIVHPAGQLARSSFAADLVLRGQREADPAPHALVDVVVDAVVGVAEDDRSVAHPQVDVLVAVDVPDPAALAAVDVDGVLAPGSEVGIRAAGQTWRHAATVAIWPLSGPPRGARAAGSGAMIPPSAGGRDPTVHSGRRRRRRPAWPPRAGRVSRGTQQLSGRWCHSRWPFVNDFRTECCCISANCAIPRRPGRRDPFGGERAPDRAGPPRESHELRAATGAGPGGADPSRHP